jgi:DNA-binding transcriptional LysR family regulator
MVALPLAPDNRRVLCASPNYFKQHAAPKKLADLQAHNCLRFVLGETVHERWSFHRNKKTEAVTVHGDRVSDDGDLVRRWAIAGNGLAYKSRLDISQDLKKGRLIAALVDYQGELAPLNLVCAHRLMLSPAVVSLRDFLRQRLEQLKD